VAGGWRIDPDGVATTLQNVVSTAGTFASALGMGEEGQSVADSRLALMIEDTATASQSMAIGEAVVGFFEQRIPTIESVGARIQACIAGASGATQAIVDGDEEMAVATQAAAALSATTGDLTLLEQGTP
jgi:hypothetical protein